MTMLPLAGKRILFFCMATFGYEKMIVSALRGMGGDVVFRGDRPFETPWYRALLRVIPRLGWLISDTFHRRWLKKLGNQSFDFVFVIKGEGLSPRILLELRGLNRDSTFVLYLWDSIRNIPAISKKLASFDRICSFDPADCRRLPALHYRPLFFVDTYWNPRPEAGHGIFFVGTLNGDRPHVLRGLVKAVESSGSQVDYWLFVRSRIELWLRRISDSALRALDAKRLIRAPLSAVDIARRFAACTAVLDIQHHMQVGLTMRTFEVLAAGKKLVTTNARILDEPFYDPKRIAIVDRHNPIIDRNFLTTPDVPLGEDFRTRYGIAGWLLEVLDLPADYFVNEIPGALSSSTTLP